MLKILIRNVFFQTPPFKPILDEIEIEDDEWIINIETINPNPHTGSGVRMWIAKLS